LNLESPSSKKVLNATAPEFFGFHEAGSKRTLHFTLGGSMTSGLLDVDEETQKVLKEYLENFSGLNFQTRKSKTLIAKVKITIDTIGEHYCIILKVRDV
jgi:hypothetical protein